MTLAPRPPPTSLRRRDDGDLAKTVARGGAKGATITGFGPETFEPLEGKGSAEKRPKNADLCRSLDNSGSNLQSIVCICQCEQTGFPVGCLPRGETKHRRNGLRSLLPETKHLAFGKDVK